VALSRSSIAEPTRITKRPSITDKQIERESVWPLGYSLDLIAFFFVRWFGIFGGATIIEGTLNFLALELFFHATVVEFLYYIFHRALHVQWLYKRWHQYHHKSINTEPTTAVSFEVGERLAYTALFAIAPILAAHFGTTSLLGLMIYFLWFDLMNEGGHINFEVVPLWYFKSPLRYIFYSPTFHSVHHTKFKKNYSLFMPWTDILFGTAVYTYDEQIIAANNLKAQSFDEEAGVGYAVETQEAA
jgi:aldehyde decarbonylase